MKLYLVRHGEAGNDAERSLSPNGVRQAKQTAEWAAGKNLTVTEIRHSGKRRAEQTAGIIGNRIAPGKEITVMSGIKPDDDPLEALAGLEAENLSSIMLVGHNPFMGVLVHHLLSQNHESRSLTFHTGTIACLAKNSSGWALDDTFTP